MHAKYLRCVSCGKKYDVEEIVFRCDCGETLEIVYDFRYLKDKLTWQGLRTRPFGHWRYREFYPVIRADRIISLDEGGTALIKASTLAEELSLPNLYFKFEGLNPTGSFKDRGSTVEISRALELGAKEVVCATTGNMGGSVAAYASRAGIKSTIYIPKGAPAIKVRQIKSYGAKVVRVDGSYNDAADMAYKRFEKEGVYLTGDYTYRGEGEKSVAFEISDESDPDWVYVPMGNGTLISGMFRGFRELKKTGLIKRPPKLAGIQALGCDPIVRAFKTKAKDVSDYGKSDTIAGAIDCPDPLDGLEALESLRKNRGLTEAVTDDEILNAQKELARKEGIYAEPSGAASLAGLVRTREKIKDDATVVVVVSGHGLKTKY